MDSTPTPPEGPSNAPGGPELRRHTRIFDPFPTTARGVDADGEDFDITTVLGNFSAGGLYLRLPKRIEPGAKLFAVVRLSTANAPEVPAPLVAVRGTVVRVDPKPDGGSGVGVKFTRHRFL